MSTTVDYFPVFLKLQGKRCLLVGAGPVAARKARLLLAAGAELTVIAPSAGEAIEELATAGRLRIQRRSFHPLDARDCWLVVSATGIAAVDRAVFAAANEAGVFCNSVDNESAGSYITPAIVDRSPLLVAISSGGSAPVLAMRVREKIETLLAPNLGRLADFAARWRQRVQRTQEDKSVVRTLWQRVFDGPIASAVLGQQIETADKLMASLVKSTLSEDTSANGGAGMAWLVGAGPGNPDLLTLRALRILQSADVILHDRLVPEAILDLARRDADRVSVGKRPGTCAMTQERINACLVQLVASGKRVCRLKGGDPFIFGRGGEEAAALADAGLHCEVVPGITAAAGCAAYAGIPLTHRDLAQSVVFVTGHGKHSVDTLDWASLARERQTLAVYMGVQNFADLMNNLIQHGRAADTPIAIIERGTTPEQRVIRGNLGQLTLLAQAHSVESPAMLIVGEVARLNVARETERRIERRKELANVAPDKLSSIATTLPTQTRAKRRMSR